MTAPEVDWTLTQLGSVVGSLSVPLRRVDRDESRILEGDVRTREAELRDANYVGATLADVSNDPVGTEYDHAREAVVGVRIEGLHHSEWGHVDEEGVDGVPWEDLVSKIRSAVLAERRFPDAGGSGVSYTDLQVVNEAPQSSDWKDYYRHDFDVVFSGYEELS